MEANLTIQKTYTKVDRCGRGWQMLMRCLMFIHDLCKDQRLKP